MSTNTHSKKRQNYSTIPHNKITVIAICRIAVHFRIAQNYKQKIAYLLLFYFIYYVIVHKVQKAEQ